MPSHETIRVYGSSDAISNVIAQTYVEGSHVKVLYENANLALCYLGALAKALVLLKLLRKRGRTAGGNVV